MRVAARGNGSLTADRARERRERTAQEPDTGGASGPLYNTGAYDNEGTAVKRPLGAKSNQHVFDVDDMGDILLDGGRTEGDGLSSPVVPRQRGWRRAPQQPGER